MEHKELVAAALKWLTGSCGCAFAVGEIVAWTGEIPDAIGFKSNRSIVVECKTSRADFLADNKKPFRAKPEKGMGDHRYFLCPEGVIKPEDQLNGWGLLYLKNGRIKRIVCPVTKKAPDFWNKGKIKNYTDWDKKPHIKSINKEYVFIISVARRLAEGCPYITKKISVRKRP
jgi:hypothetical protein